MKAGKAVSRPSWPEYGACIYIVPAPPQTPPAAGAFIVYGQLWLDANWPERPKQELRMRRAEQVWTPLTEALLADDWVVLDLSPEDLAGQRDDGGAIVPYP